MPFERITVITGAYDKRDPDPKKNYGFATRQARANTADMLKEKQQ